MSTAHNKYLVQRFYTEILSQNDLERVNLFIGPNYLDHDAGPGSVIGPELVRTQAQALRSIFPDFTLEIEDIIAEDDRVVTRVVIRGTHQGQWGQIEPTGTNISVSGINIDRVEDGRIVEHWGEADTMGILSQIGVDPLSG
jgi:predicted ester cyclase